MVLRRQDTVKRLAPLLDASMQGERMLAAAAEGVSEIALKTLLIADWQSHAESVQTLKEQIARLGGVGSTQVGLAGEHYELLEGGISDSAEERILRAIQKTERDLIQRYEQTMQSPLPADVRRQLAKDVEFFKQVSGHAASYLKQQDAPTDKIKAINGGM